MPLTIAVFLTEGDMLIDWVSWKEDWFGYKIWLFVDESG